MSSVMRYTTICVIAGAIAGGCVTAGSGFPASGPGPGTIIYAVTLRNEYPAIYRLDLVPHRWRRLIANADQPEVSRSGRRIAFVRRGNIWIANSDGTHQLRITRTGRDSDPAWGPRDRILYFSRTLGNAAAGVFSIPVRGGRAVQLTHPAANVCHLDPAPDPTGRVIGYEQYPDCVRGGAVWLKAVRSDGRGATGLAEHFQASRNGTRNVAGLSWSPNGRDVAFAGFDLDQTLRNGMYVSRRNGDRARRIWAEEQPDYDTDTAWSRDGVRVAFTVQAAVWIARPGGGVWNVTGHIAPSDSPSWLP